MPRPRFTLRIVLVVTAIVAVVVWQANIVYERKFEMRRSHTFILAKWPEGAAAELSVNPLRSLFGDEPVRIIYMNPEGDWEREQTRLSKLFPEGKIDVMHPHYAF